MDEATSALDTETELELTRPLDHIRKELTVVQIAHRLSLVRKSDRLVYLDMGQMTAEGSFSELKAEVKDFAKAIEIMGLED